jgi:hypothetical protein
MGNNMLVGRGEIGEKGELIGGEKPKGRVKRITRVVAR